MTDEIRDDPPAPTGDVLQFKPDAPKGNGEGRTAPGVCHGCGKRIPPAEFKTLPQGLHHVQKGAKGEGLNHRYCGPIFTEFTYHLVYIYRAPGREGMDRCFLDFDSPLILQAQIQLAEAVIATQLADQWQATDDGGRPLVGVKPEVGVRVLSWTPLDRR